MASNSEPSNRRRNIVSEPLFQQVAKDLRIVIESDYVPGDRFLSERDVEKRYGVSRITANKAIGVLVAEGYLQSRKGIGSFVTERKLAAGLRTMGFTRNVKQYGREPSTRVIQFERGSAGSLDLAVRKILSLEPHDEVYEIRRVRLVDAIPMILEHRFIPVSLLPDLHEDNLSGSLFAYINTIGYTITNTDEAIHPVVIEGEAANLLDVPAGKAGFLVESIGYVGDDQALWWETTLHRPDGFELRCRVVVSGTETERVDQFTMKLRDSKKTPRL